MRLTRAVTHIRLCEANHAKIAAVDALAAEYLGLCQQYTTYFCTETPLKKLPSTQNPKLARQVRQEINRAVNELYHDYPQAQYAYERLNVAGMRFKARRMNAYLYASNLAHIPAQLAWGAVKRGIRARKVMSAFRNR
jgi:hypothetical protein